MSKECTSPFVPSGKVFEKEFTETEFIHYMDVEEVAEGFNPEKPSEFLINTHSEEYERVPIDEYINSFASKVGLKNELKGIISSAQMDDFIANHKAKPGFVDLTKLPDSQFAMKEFSEKVESVWSSIPDELKAGLSKEEFLKQITADKLKDYVLSKMPKTDEKKEGEL